jgi:hypothetical protein
MLTEDMDFADEYIFQTTAGGLQGRDRVRPHPTANLNLREYNEWQRSMNMNENFKKEENNIANGKENGVGLGLGVALGLCVGAALGAVFSNVPVGVALGITFGAAFSSLTSKNDKNRRDDKN